MTKPAFPRPGLFKASGAIKVDDGAPGQDVGEFFLACCFQGFAAALVGREKPLTEEELLAIAESCERLVKLFVDSPA